MKKKRYKSAEDEVDVWKRKLYDEIKDMNWPQRWEYIHRITIRASPDPKYCTVERRAEQRAYVQKALAKYRAQKAAKKAAEAAQAALVFSEDSAEYNTQTT